MMSIYEVNQQTIADQLLSMAMGAPPSPARQRARIVVSQFERRGWQPAVLEDAFQRTWPGQFGMDETGHLSYAPATGDRSEIAEAVARLLVEYAMLTLSDEDPGQPSELLTTEQAAELLGISPRGVRRLVYETHELDPLKLGHDLSFRKADLEKYQRNRRKVGRPAKVS